MRIDYSKVHLHWRARWYKGKEYRSYSLARSYKINGKVRKEIVQRIGPLSDDDVIQWRRFLSEFKKSKKLSNEQFDGVTNIPCVYTVDSAQKSLESDTTEMKKIEYTDADQEIDIRSYEEAVKNAFIEVQDVRLDNINYPFYGILLIILAATLAGCTAITHIYEYSKAKRELFRRLLGIEHEPSYSLFWWILTRTNHEELNQAFARWIRVAAGELENKIIAIDGKRLRGAKNIPIHYVSAYECTHGFLLGQVKTEEKSNEITAIPELLKVIDVEGAIITIDAAGCQKAIVKDIKERGGDYIIALKGNQDTLYAEAQNYFSQARVAGYEWVDCERDISHDKGHGRIETREITVIRDLEWLDCLKDWRDLRSLIEVKSTRAIKGHSTEELRYYISSKDMSAETANKNIRLHWGIENSLHWVLDVIFGDDLSRANRGHAGENLGLFRRMAYFLFKQDSEKGTMASKKRLAMWEESYMLKLLANFMNEVNCEADLKKLN